jgi:hypothetical protein
MDNFLIFWWAAYTRILEWPISLQMSQVLKKSLAKAQSTPRKPFAVLAYMDVGQGRKQDAEALRLRLQGS